LHQAKEKFGTLRFYWDAGERILDPGDPEPAAPAKDASDTDWEAWHVELEAWGERLERYLESDEGTARTEDLKRRVGLAEQLVEAIGARAAATCELCGKPGEPHSTRASLRWYKTLCAACAHASDYIAVRPR
jgi:hypothetical protein